MGEIKAIETVYNGYRFRSRLEARWAVFFDAIELDYQYEPQGFVGLGDIPYLPDFYFPEKDIYAEVKGTDRDLLKDTEKILGVIDFNCTPVSNGLIILGDIPNPELIGWGNIPIFNMLYCDKGIALEKVAFVKASWTKIIIGEQEVLNNIFSYEQSYERCDWVNGYFPEGTSVKHKWSRESLLSNKFDALKNAYAKARQARFEHGETPTV